MQRPYKGVGIEITKTCSVGKKNKYIKDFSTPLQEIIKKIVFFKVKFMSLVIDNSAKSMPSSADTCLTEQTALVCVYVCVCVS